MAALDLRPQTHVLRPLLTRGLSLPNRVIMAPMTRTRAGFDRIPSEMMVAYYAARASAGLIISECIAISDDAASILRAPGLYTEAHVAGWRRVTDAVHAQGGRIFAQLWHPGRIGHESLQPGGLAPIAPSALRAEGTIFTPQGRQPHALPRALETFEIPLVVAKFAAATKSAREAGFDGVELHGAFGYLVDQFLQDGTNKRQDSYGGTLENRARFLFQVVDAMTEGWDRDHVGVKLSPANRFNGIADSDPLAIFGFALEGLSQRAILYVHLMEPSASDLAAETLPIREVTRSLGRHFKGLVIANGGFTKAKADEIIALGLADMVSFGVPYIANPDLVERFATGAALNPADPTTFYGEGARGYLDYPVLNGTTPLLRAV